MYIHAFDPGMTTGFALLEVKSPRVLEVVLSDVFTVPQDYTDWFTDISIVYHPEIVIIEAFRLYREKAQDLVGSYMPAAESVGVIKYLCWRLGLPWIEQMASCKFPFARFATILEVIPSFKKPATGHEIDAIRHGLYWWFNTGIKA